MPEHERAMLPLWLDILLTIAVTLVFAALLRIFVAEMFIVPTGSMLDTIQLQDHILGEKLTIRFGSAKRGDIVTFNDPDGSGVILVKRVIALGGQTVELVDGVVYVDGVALDEPYTQGKRSDPIVPSMYGEPLSYPYYVPEGYVWLMGDNRIDSLDSRYFGAVSLSELTSRAVCVVWPFSNARFF